MVAVGGAGGGVDKTGDPGIPGRDKHVQETGHVVFIGSNRVIERAGHAPEGGFSVVGSDLSNPSNCLNKRPKKASF